MREIKKTDKFKFYTGLFTAKAVNSALHAAKRSGTSLPGLVALKISDNFLSFVSKYCEKSIITITGTNGKTTTAGLLAHIINLSGNTVLNNEKGANMLSGIASSLAVNYKPFSKFDYAVLESDEAYLTKLYDYIKSDFLLVTNLFRDQLDRYGELDTTAKKIQEAILKNPDLKLIINADDPMLLELGAQNEKIIFGFDDIIYQTKTTESQAPAESAACKCGNPFSYKHRIYAHIGHYYCENCHRQRIEPINKASAVIYDDFSEIYIKDPNGLEQRYKTNLVGLYNAYNALAAIVAAKELGITPENIQKGLDTYKPAFGRAEKITIKNRNLLVQLIKNPTGASEVLRTINQNEAEKLLIVINDNYADGRDVSWLWDTDFELLKDYPKNIVVSGERAYDMAVRLKYAGFDEQKIEIKNDIKTALNYCINTIEENKRLVIMPTYTALLEMQKIFKALNQ